MDCVVHHSYESIILSQQNINQKWRIFCWNIHWKMEHLEQAIVYADFKPFTNVCIDWFLILGLVHSTFTCAYYKVQPTPGGFDMILWIFQSLMLTAIIYFHKAANLHEQSSFIGCVKNTPQDMLTYGSFANASVTRQFIVRWAIQAQVSLWLLFLFCKVILKYFFLLRHVY